MAVTSSKGGRAELMQLLEKLEIRSQVVEHPAVFTVEEMMPHVGHLVGAHSKNLFLRDKKKKGLWLVTTLAEREVNLGDLGKKLSVSGGLRFADEDVMIDTLNVAQGCCTPLALFNDKDRKVQFILDDDFINGGHEQIFFHPMVNEATLGMSPQDFLKFLEAIEHKPTLISFQ
ncbi:prolyl-tRNA synthetase associated domain-containing protein 1-like [Corticium candelabrum]|uniref:prolyl-tRNA synthetase associated domain-containing protein 1-like n=1 Tax=Corticium candelabrum TaxID=121492 RepID=UPI002E26DAB7|nr:prolyl-tRNA synthetase associated domain-containing protein 1-like [Corticium candelabrum]